MSNVATNHPAPGGDKERPPAKELPPSFDSKIWDLENDINSLKETELRTKAKSSMIHGLTGDLVEPTHTLLNSIDPLIGLINKGDNNETLAFVEGIKKNIIDLCAVVGKLAENSDRLKTVEQE